MKWIAALIFMTLAWTEAAADHALSAPDARAQSLAGKLIVVDIRTPQEWKLDGIADVAHAIDMQDELFISKLLKLRDANPGRPIALICATGGRSAYVVKALGQRGLHLMDIREGMHGSAAGPGWLRRKLPLRAAGAAVKR